MVKLPKLERPFTLLKRLSVKPTKNAPTFNNLLKKLKPPLNPKKPRPFVSLLNFNKPNKKSIEDSLKRMKKLIIPEEMPPDPLNKSKPLLIMKSDNVVKPSEAERRWNLI